LTYQAGRIASYSLAGALVGSIGGLLQATVDVDKAALVARSLAGLVLILAAVGILSKWRPLSRWELVGARLWKHLAPAARAIPKGGLRSSLLLGMLWGWLPCGLVYSMLLVAALGGGPVMGAGTMLSFGLGTAPAVLATGLLGGKIWRVATAHRVNLAAGSILLIFGILTMLAPLSGQAH
jgi:sulfite exporter TauE/SafE